MKSNIIKFIILLFLVFTQIQCFPPFYEINISNFHPEIDVSLYRFNRTKIICQNNGLYNLGEIIVDDQNQKGILSINNSGDKFLTLTGNPLIDVTGDIEEIIIEESNDSIVGIDLPDDFYIYFKPMSIGLKTINVLIKNNDSDESNYQLTITATAL